MGGGRASRRRLDHRGLFNQLEGIQFELNGGGKISLEHETEALRLLCQEVKPAF